MQCILLTVKKHVYVQLKCVCDNGLWGQWYTHHNFHMWQEYASMIDVKSLTTNISQNQHHCDVTNKECIGNTYM